MTIDNSHGVFGIIPYSSSKGGVVYNIVFIILRKLISRILSIDSRLLIEHLRGDIFVFISNLNIFLRAFVRFSIQAHFIMLYIIRRP